MKALRTFQNPHVSCAVSVAGGDRRGLEELIGDGACVQSVLSA